MKLRLLLAVFALALPGVALGGPSATVLTGTFQKKISKKAPPLNGTWKLKLKQDGTFELSRNGVIAVRGVAAGVAGRLAVADRSGPYRCKGRQYAATYTYTLRGKVLTLRPVLEPCFGRKSVLTTGSFTRQ
jgi:hypothetical protein